MERHLVIKQGIIHDVVEGTTYVADILVKDGKINKIADIIEGREINNARVIDGTNCHVYPGFVDAHCHLGLDGYAVGFEAQDFNELNDSVTPQLRAIDAINPMDKTFELARKAGITTVATGPGSSNVIGGTFAVIKTAGKVIDDMIVKRDAAMKCAFGENPKACYKGSEVYSRMTIAAKIRTLLIQTMEYEKKREAAKGDVLKEAAYNPKYEAMIPVLHKDMPLKAHVHRADDIMTAIRLAKEFDLRLTLDHCTEGHLIADELAKEAYSLAVGPSFGHATKPELINKSMETPGILAKAGCNVSIITDSPVIQEQYLPLCAIKAVEAGMDEADALRAITINAAKHVGVENRVGSIEVGKDGDFVITDQEIMTGKYSILYTIILGEPV